MKIIAYSQIPATVPFVHLGYLSASTVSLKPVQGLLVSGLILLVADLSLLSKHLWQQRRLPETIRAAGLYPSRHVLIRYVLLPSAVRVLCSAYIFGEKKIHYEHPYGATLEHIWEIENNILGQKDSRSDPNQACPLPTQEGEYDVLPFIRIPWSVQSLYRKKRLCFDAWNMPLKLRVTQGEGVLKYAVVSSGPDRIMGTADDVTRDVQRSD
jgi:hypothetical protein